MKDNKHIQSFNEHGENLNSELSKDTSSSISDISESNKNEYFDVKYILELVRDKTITLDEGVERIIQYYSH